MTMIFNFFAMPDEVVSLWNWIGEMPGMRFIETDSRPGLPIREAIVFSADELWSKDRDFGIEAWPSNAGGNPVEKYIEFEPNTARRLGAPGRTSLFNPAIFNIHRQVSTPHETLIGPCELLFWTEKLALRARRFSVEQVESVDWQSHHRTIAEIKKHIRKNAVANWRSTSVSAGVAHQLNTTGAKLWLWGPTGTI